MKHKTKKIAAKSKLEDGKNIRFTKEGHDVIKSYVDSKGLKLSAFCETAALEKIKSNQ